MGLGRPLTQGHERWAGDREERKRRGEIKTIIALRFFLLPFRSSKGQLCPFKPGQTAFLSPPPQHSFRIYIGPKLGSTSPSSSFWKIGDGQKRSGDVTFCHLLFSSLPRSYMWTQEGDRERKGVIGRQFPPPSILGTEGWLEGLLWAEGIFPRFRYGLFLLLLDRRSSHFRHLGALLADLRFALARTCQKSLKFTLQVWGLSESLCGTV